MSHLYLDSNTNRPQSTGLWGKLPGIAPFSRLSRQKERGKPDILGHGVAAHLIMTQNAVYS